jgi:hypothetical protein
MTNLIVAKPGWSTPRLIAKTLKVKRINDVVRINVNRPKKIVNWGRTDFPSPRNVAVLNRPEIVALTRNKLYQFRTIARAQVPLPEWTEHPQEALAWAAGGHTVFGRRSLQGQSGRGITLLGPRWLMPNVDNIRDIGLFTKHWKCDYEARYHVFNGEVIDIQRKMRISPERFELLPEPVRRISYWIRNHVNGWIFGRGGVARHAGAVTAAINAVRALGLDFGAVDIRIRGNKAVVLEVNSAPGLEGTTREKYTQKIKEFFNANMG